MIHGFDRLVDGGLETGGVRGGFGREMTGLAGFAGAFDGVAFGGSFGQPFGSGPKVVGGGRDRRGLLRWTTPFTTTMVAGWLACRGLGPSIVKIWI
ncbi:MAG: hypothetical protein WBG11_07675 [Methylocella sp.]